MLTNPRNAILDMQSGQLSCVISKMELTGFEPVASDRRIKR